MKYSIGDAVRYCSLDGSQRLVRVENKSDDIRNGRPGFSGPLLGLDHEPVPAPRWVQLTVWGYDTQIIGVFPAKGE